MNKPLVPAQKARLQVLKSMPAALQEVATDFESKLCRGAQNIILIQYDMGARIAAIIEDEATYGSGAVQQLAAYLNIPGGTTTLYNLRNFAKAFARDYVKEWSSKPMANGRFLELSHWFQLMKLSSRKDQDNMLARVLKNSLSCNELEQEIRAGALQTRASRAGGRNPVRPKSPIAGLQKTFGLVQQLNRFEEVANVSVFAELEKIPEEEITPALSERLQKTLEQLETAYCVVDRLREKCIKALKRTKQVLQKHEKNNNDEEE